MSHSSPRSSAIIGLAITALLAICIVAALLTSCGGGGSAAPATDVRVALAVPGFDVYSTDLTDANEGTAFDPLRIGFSPNCVFGGVVPDCNPPGPLPTFIFQQSNARATSHDPARWRYVMNLEDAWDPSCNTGPPGQSLDLAAAPIVWQPGSGNVVIGFDLATDAPLCRNSNLPYVAATFIRGTQGDPVRYIATWGKGAQLTFYTRIEHTTGLNLLQHVYFWLHFVDPVTGKRYMALTWLYQSGTGPGDKSRADYLGFMWNWPEVDSYYYPGAQMQGGELVSTLAAGTPCNWALRPYCKPGDTRLAADVQINCSSAVQTDEALGVTRWRVDVEALGRCRFPEFDAIHPYFQGAEWAAEGGSLDYAHPTGTRNTLKVTLSGVAITANP